MAVHGMYGRSRIGSLARLIHTVCAESADYIIYCNISMFAATNFFHFFILVATGD